jgi:hypothetical protein
MLNKWNEWRFLSPGPENGGGTPEPEPVEADAGADPLPTDISVIPDPNPAQPKEPDPVPYNRFKEKVDEVNQYKTDYQKAQEELQTARIEKAHLEEQLKIRTPATPPDPPLDPSKVDWTDPEAIKDFNAKMLARTQKIEKDNEDLRNTLKQKETQQTEQQQLIQAQTALDSLLSKAQGKYPLGDIDAVKADFLAFGTHGTTMTDEEVTRYLENKVKQSHDKINGLVTKSKQEGISEGMKNYEKLKAQSKSPGTLPPGQAPAGKPTEKTAFTGNAKADSRSLSQKGAQWLRDHTS